MSCLVCSCGDFAHVRPAADDSADLKIVSKIVIFDFQNPVTFLLKRAPRESLSAGLLAGPDRKDRPPPSVVRLLHGLLRPGRVSYLLCTAVCCVVDLALSRDHQRH